MKKQPQDTLEEFRRLVGSLPSGPGGGIELVISQLVPETADLLRFGAIPHLLDRSVAAVLMPGSEQSSIDRAMGELLELSFVKPESTGARLHDEARRYLLQQWFGSRKNNEDRYRRFKEANASLSSHYADRRANLTGAANVIAERSEIYHRIAAEQPGAFGQFRQRVMAERLNFRLESCEALVSVVAELEPVLDDVERAWLRYLWARLHTDERRFDEARDTLLDLRRDPTISLDPELAASILFCLHDTYRGERDFSTALQILNELLDYLQGHPEEQQRRLEATHTMAALLVEMGQPARAEVLLTTLLSAPEIHSDRSLLARILNTLGTAHRRLGHPRRALDAYRESLATLEQANERFRPMQVYNNIGSLHAERAEWEEAHDNLDHALAIARDFGDFSGEATVLGNLARVYFGLSQPDEAVAATEKAIELFQSIHNWFEAGTLSRNLARSYRRLGKIEEARNSFQRASDLFRLGGENDEAEKCSRLAQLDKQRRWGLGRWLAIAVGILALASLLVFTLSYLFRRVYS